MVIGLGWEKNIDKRPTYGATVVYVIIFCESVCAVSVNEYRANGILFDFGLRRRGKIFDFAEFAGAQSPEIRAQKR